MNHNAEISRLAVARSQAIDRAEAAEKERDALKVDAEKLNARIAKLEFVAARAEDLATLGDQLWHSKGKTRKPRDHREGALRRALQALGTP